MDRELRCLLITAVALVVVLFTGRALVSALWDDEEAVRQAGSLAAKLRSGGEADSRPARQDMAAAAALRDELAERIDALVPAMSYTQPAEFTVGAGESPDLRYIEIVRREQERLVKGAAFVGRSVPSNLGLPDLNPTGMEDVMRALRSLHVVHVVLDAALAAGVDAVDEIKVPVAGRRARAETGFLRGQRVEFELHGSPAAVRGTLARIAGGTPWLALDDLRLDASDEDGARVTCRFSATALVIDPGQPATPEGQG